MGIQLFCWYRCVYTICQIYLSVFSHPVSITNTVPSKGLVTCGQSSCYCHLVSQKLFLKLLAFKAAIQNIFHRSVRCCTVDENRVSHQPQPLSISVIHLYPTPSLHLQMKICKVLGLARLILVRLLSHSLAENLFANDCYFLNN